MKTYDNGSLFTVAFDHGDTEEFSDQWPCSTVRGKGSFQFEKRYGDLVDATGAALHGDGPDWLAFSHDCQTWGRAVLHKRDKGNCQTFGCEMIRNHPGHCESNFDLEQILERMGVTKATAPATKEVRA